MFWVQILSPPLPPTFFNFLNIVQYLFVHCTIPSILGSHHPYPTSSPTPNIAFTFFYIFFLLFFFLKYIESVLGSNIAPPSPLPHFFNFLNIVQYLFVQCTIPSILGLHHPYPTSPPTPNIAFPSTLTPPSPPPPRFFFLNFHKNFTTQFTSTLTSTFTSQPPPPPGFCFNFHKNFTSLFTPLPPPTPQFFFFLDFHKTSLLRSHPFS